MPAQPGEFWVADIPFNDGTASKRLDCLEQSLLIARIGAISPHDAQAIKQVWASQVKPQF